MKKQIVSSIIFVVLTVGLAVLTFTYFNVQEREKNLTDDLQRRSLLFSDSLRESLTPNVNTESTPQIQSLIDTSAANERIIGIIVYNNKGEVLAKSSGFPENLLGLDVIASTAMDQNTPSPEILRDAETNRIYALGTPIHEDESIIGSFIVLHNASYIDTEIFALWRNAFLRLLLYSLLIAITLFITIQWIISKPFIKVLEAIKGLKTGETIPEHQYSQHHYLRPILDEVSSMHRNMLEAQTAATYEARLRLEKLDASWTVERLKEFTKNTLKGRNLYVISNREPYIHVKKNGSIQTIQPASGMVTALDPLMKACGGTWIAHGSGPYDKEVVDHQDKVAVPPNDPKYTLKRFWLSSKEEEGYYYGFSNNGLWPLCHSAFVEPIFRESDWKKYKEVNEKVARVVLDEIKNVHKPILFIQDYHFTLLPRIIKESRPDATIGLFWHIPWPSPESFRICPWRREIITGMLGADLLAFHTQLHCNNFLDTVRKELEALIDLEQFAVIKNDHLSYIKPFPIGIAFPEDQGNMNSEKREEALKELGIPKTEYIGVGVDRMDYTKGIIERFRSIERFLELYPSYHEKFTFLQVAPPTRSSVPSYQRFAQEVERELERVNNRFKTRKWKPIIFINKHLDREKINIIYNIGNICMVTSLHDGMNLVAKEYVAARADEQGVLILSQFTGASRELKDALIINPYDTDETAHAMRTGLEMSESEQITRMQRLREIVRNNNVYRWSAEILKAMATIETE